MYKPEKTADIAEVEDLLCISYYRPGGLGYFLANYECSFNDHSLLGRGGFGQVYRGSKVLTNKQCVNVAIKRVKQDMVKKYVTKAKSKKKQNLVVPIEVELLARSQSVPGVVKLEEFFFMNGYWVLVMQHTGVNNIDLFDHISRSQYLHESDVAHILFQLLNILYGLHFAGVLHRDLKDENILIDSETNEITLIDFGSGAFLTDDPYFDFEGTRVYSPPEWIVSRKYDGKRAEIWSLGILMFDMLMGNIPFETDTDIVMGKVSIPRLLTSECTSLLLNCLKHGPQERPSLMQVLQDPFFRAHTHNKITNMIPTDEYLSFPSSTSSQIFQSNFVLPNSHHSLAFPDLHALRPKLNSPTMVGCSHSSPSGGSSTVSGETLRNDDRHEISRLHNVSRATSCQIAHYTAPTRGLA